MWEAVAGYAFGRLHEKKITRNDELYAQKFLTAQLSYALDNPESFEGDINEDISSALTNYAEYLLDIFSGIVSLGEITNIEVQSISDLIIDLCDVEYELSEIKNHINKYKNGNGEKTAKRYYKEVNEYFDEEFVDEWKIIFQAIVLLALNDDEITDEETNYLTSIGKAFKISENDIDSLILEMKTAARSLVDNESLDEALNEERAFLDQEFENKNISQDEYENRKNEIKNELKFLEELRYRKSYTKSEEAINLEYEIEELKELLIEKSERKNLIDKITNISLLVGKETEKLDELPVFELKQKLEQLESIYSEYLYRRHLENKLEETISRFGDSKENKEIQNLNQEMKELKIEYKNDFSNSAYERSILNLIFKHLDLYEDQSLIKTLKEQKHKLEKDINYLD